MARAGTQNPVHWIRDRWPLQVGLRTRTEKVVAHPRPVHTQTLSFRAPNNEWLTPLVRLLSPCIVRGNTKRTGRDAEATPTAHYAIPFCGFAKNTRLLARPIDSLVRVTRRAGDGPATPSLAARSTVPCPGGKPINRDHHQRGAIAISQLPRHTEHPGLTRPKTSQTRHCSPA